MLAVFIILFIVLVIWYSCNSCVLNDLKTYKTNMFNQPNSLSGYEYLFFTKELPLDHPKAQNFHFVKPTELGLYIGRPSFLKFFSENILIPWESIHLCDGEKANDNLCVLYVPSIKVWLGVKEKHQKEIEKYISKE